MRILLALSLIACTSTPPDTATGRVAAWTAGPALPVPRANHCSAVIDDWVLVIGGNHMDTTGFVSTDEIDAAQLAADGTLGPWQVAGHTASPVSQCNATSNGKTLYIIDGLYDTETDNGQVYTADLDATGHLGALGDLGALPAGVVAISTAANVHDGTLMLMDTTLPTDPDGDKTLTLDTPLAAAALTWTTDDWGIPFREQPEYAFTDKFAYTLGGYHDTDVGAVTDVFVAPIGANAAVGTAAMTTAMPMPVGWGKAEAVDGFVFVVGGRSQTFAAGGTTSVYVAPIDADGTLGAWQTETALPTARTNHAMVLAGDYLVVTGGATSGPGDAMVFVAQVRYPAAH